MTRQVKMESERDGQQQAKKRKTLSGPIRDKSRTMARLVAAVGEVLEKYGYSGLTAPNVAAAAGLDKKLVWTYFGGLDNLVEEYIQQRDFWKRAGKDYIDDLMKDPERIGGDEIAVLLKKQFDTISNDGVLQKLIHWELGEKNKILQNIVEKREEIGEDLFQVIVPHFDRNNVDIRSRLALLVGGIYYLSLHGKTQGSTFCGVSINTDEGRKRIENAIHEMISETYEKAGILK